MIAVRTNNIVTDMFASIHNICSAVFAVQRSNPAPRPSEVPLEVRRQAVVPRSAPGPVLEVMLKNWPMDTIVKEVLDIRMKLARAAIDHDDEAGKACEQQLTKLAGLVEQHELREPGFAKRMWERVDERTEKDQTDFVEHTLLDVIHGGYEPGTVGAELSEELKLALYQMTHKPTDVPSAEASVLPPVEGESPEDVVNRAMQELAKNQQSSI